ncbi:hypothetical protein JTE90_027550 [Oedothorax gibbosus]|uniref:DNA-directed RNA polymerase III subunit n=1 Tax=Oedothorax gibbosus TaxID=931172 RepID=A0AAV6VJT7_9ARAC|nr:hypothetical protein JTE90_027550 [Oedothorax gibbosus]
MSGRGRGRGRGFPPKKTGFGTEDVPPPLNQPPPIYPQLLFKPVPLVTGKKMMYTLTLKQEIRTSFRESGYFVQPVSVKKDIERYTDKYELVHAADQIAWDKALFPKELFAEPQKKKKKVPATPKKEIAIVQKLEVLEEKEKKEEGDVEPEEEEEEMVEEEDNEEELEDETDYASNYFDNGENYLDEDDDNDNEGYEY